MISDFKQIQELFEETDQKLTNNVNIYIIGGAVLREDVWITWIGERVESLEAEGINIPIMKEINKLRDKYFEQIEKNIKQKQRRKSNQRT